MLSIYSMHSLYLSTCFLILSVHPQMCPLKHDVCFYLGHSKILWIKMQMHVIYTSSHFKATPTCKHKHKTGKTDIWNWSEVCKDKVPCAGLSEERELVSSRKLCHVWCNTAYYIATIVTMTLLWPVNCMLTFYKTFAKSWMMLNRRADCN